MAYPERLSLTCNSGSGGLLCLGDKEINDTIIMEQKIIYERAGELFILSNFSFDLQWANGLLEQTKKKTKVSIFFRQVSHIEKNSNRIHIFFAAFVNSALQANYNILMNIILSVGKIRSKNKQPVC